MAVWWVGVGRPLGPAGTEGVAENFFFALTPGTRLYRISLPHNCQLGAGGSVPESSTPAVPLGRVIPPSPFYPSIHWLVASRCRCRHPCLSCRSLLIALSASALDLVGLRRRAVSRSIMQKNFSMVRNSHTALSLRNPACRISLATSCPGRRKNTIRRLSFTKTAQELLCQLVAKRGIHHSPRKFRVDYFVTMRRNPQPSL